MKRTNTIKAISVAFLIITASSGLIQISKEESIDTSSFWLNIAKSAWGYFEPGIGVDPTSGLVRNIAGGTAFTDWDLGLYVQAVIDAEKLCIINGNGTWGANDRLDRVLTFLEKRPLMPDGLPYLFYYSSNGMNSTEIRQVATDTGNLLIALKNVEISKPELKNRIDSIVYNSTNYERCRVSIDRVLNELKSGIREPGIYDYYVLHGFAAFWPERFLNGPDLVLNIIESTPKVNYSGVILPSASLTSEPLLMALFNLPNPDQWVVELTREAYLAQEIRYNITGKYTAFSEGGTDSGMFVWESIITGDGCMWVIKTGDSNNVDTVVKITPVVYFKAAIGYLALYNTTYTQNMVKYLLSIIQNTSGFSLGADENGRVIQSPPDVSNGLIVTAGRYAIATNMTVQLTYGWTGNTVNSVTGGYATEKTASDKEVPHTSTTPAPSPTSGIPTASPLPSTTVFPTEKPKSSHPTESGFYFVSVSVMVMIILAIGYKFGKRQ